VINSEQPCRHPGGFYLLVRLASKTEAQVSQGLLGAQKEIPASLHQSGTDVAMEISNDDATKLSTVVASSYGVAWS
jgi:hypothetical protein